MQTLTPPSDAPLGPGTISVVLIARDEEANIGECLASVAWADEIVVVEQGSRDATARLAREAGARVVQFGDWPGFGPQKNRALDAARGEWVFSLDADERVSAALARRIREAVRDGGERAFEVSRLTQFCGQWIHHCGWTPDRVLRLFRRGQARFSDDLVHERVVVAPGVAVARIDEPLLHFSYPTPAHYWRKLERYSDEWARQRHASGQTTTMTRAVLSGVVAFARSYVLRLGFLDGAMGFAVCAMQAQAAYGKYFSLYCLNRSHATSDN